MSMRFSFGQAQNQRQEQKQILSPKMIQSLDLLYLPLQELETRIDEELQSNPVLERVSDSDSGISELGDSSEISTENDVENAFNRPEREEEILIREDRGNADDFQTADDFANLYPDTIDEGPARSRNGIEEAGLRHDDLMNNLPSQGESLAEHLRGQLALLAVSPKVKEYGERIIGSLDRFGYLLTPLADLAEADSSQIEGADAKDSGNLDDWEEALRTIQEMDPPGVGARSHQECLLLQITPDMPNADELKRFVGDYYDDFINRRFPVIAKGTGWSFDKITQLLDQIRHFNLYPGASFDDSPTFTVMPDVLVEKDEKGKWRACVEEGNGTQIRIVPYYQKIVQNKGTDPEAQKYLRQNINQGQLLIDAIAQRKVTLLRVAQAIVDHQVDFFEIGPERLRPLTMQTIADLLEIHVSTVSRTCNDKWLQSPGGIYPFKHFFSGAAGKTENSGGEMATETVRAKIKEMIDAEDKGNPLSDDKIAQQLSELGIKTARRTVAKYREILNIPSSSQRRDWRLQGK